MYQKRYYQQSNNCGKQNDAPQEGNKHWKKIESEPLERSLTKVSSKGGTWQGKLGEHQKVNCNQI